MSLPFIKEAKQRSGLSQLGFLLPACLTSAGFSLATSSSLSASAGGKCVSLYRVMGVWNVWREHVVCLSLSVQNDSDLLT